uniref:Uncharacterized protein n=1 Tax=Arundo donax TaxID=35708 RepID=A0A0A9HIU0_ARUDO
MLHLTHQSQHGVAMVHTLLEPVVLLTGAILDHHHKLGLWKENCKHRALL